MLTMFWLETYCAESQRGATAVASPIPHDLLTAREVADVMRVSTMTVYRLIKAGELPAIRVGNQPYGILLTVFDRRHHHGRMYSQSP